ncbi:MAG TPA: hypothetical protein PL037_09290, partial [Elusimicrobiales bacterium]|nr:hypothetical protein [Elusimicrobiales bacterium]
MKGLFGAILVSSAVFLFYSSEPGAFWDLGSMRKTAPAPKAPESGPACVAPETPSADTGGPR